MPNRKIRDQKGFMGCSSLFIILWIAFMLAFLGLIRLNRNLFYLPPGKKVFTSRIAAKRCQQKLETFNTNKYIKTISLNELEINSSLHQEFAQGQHEPFLLVTVEMKPDKLTVEGTVILVELIPKKIRSILHLGDMKLEGGIEKRAKKEEEERRRAVIKMTSQPVIEERGKLFLNPHRLVIGKQKIPHFIIRIIYKMKPDWFNYSISPKIKTIKVGKQELELNKW